jgi:signal peptidase
MPPLGRSVSAGQVSRFYEVKSQKGENDLKKLLKQTLDTLIIIFIVFLFGLAGLSMTKGKDEVTQVAGFSVFMVKTGSMAAVEPIGSIVLAYRVPTPNIKQGDDIVFYKNQQTRVTHRVIAINQDPKAGTRLTTKGVNNQAADPEPLDAENIIGKVVLVIPNLGYLGVAIQRQPLILVIIFASGLFLHFVRELIRPVSRSAGKGKEQEIYER